MSIKVVIVGLGKAGAAVFGQLSGRQAQGIHIIGVSELNDTPGRQEAVAAGVPLMSLEEVKDLGAGVDLIFDMTGHPGIRKQMREMLFASENRHTVIAPENVALLIWALLSGEPVPEQNQRSGY